MRISEPTESMLNSEQCRIYNFYASQFGSLYEYVNLYKKLIGITEGTVVDLGSGPCNFIIALANRFPKLNFVCYENSDAMIEVANENIVNNKLTNRITILKDSLFNVSGTYDVVLSNRVLHHLEDTVKFWELINRLDTNLLIVDINRPPQSVVDYIIENDHYREPSYKEDLINSMQAAYTLDEVREQVKQYGYGVSAGTNYKLAVYHTK